jgi:hypothetical protein
MTDEELDELIRITVDRMENKFDTHELILDLAHNNQPLYVRGLHATGGDHPFQTFHARIGTSLRRLAPGLSLSEPEEWRSRDIFGQNSQCMKWRRN